MKKISLVLLLSLSTVSVFAKTRVLVSATGGFGEMGYQDGSYGIDGVNLNAQPVTGFIAGINVGTEIKRWRVETGLQYNTFGFKCTAASANSLPPGQNSWTIQYPHLSIPVKVGYVGTISKNMRVIPSAGLLTSYNMGRHIKGEIPKGLEALAAFAERSFEAKFPQISISGSLGVNFEHSIGNIVSVFAGPSFQFMLTGAEHPHSMNLTAGVNVKL